MENICEWENCKKIGEFKAPIERDNSKNFKLLCQEHIKLFNQKWNYFEGMSQDEIENFYYLSFNLYKLLRDFRGKLNGYALI